MAGYIISINSIKALESCINQGIYSTILSTPFNIWRIHYEGTCADYISMKPGDNIYFFIKRKIYGVGMLKNIGFGCKYLNYPHADVPNTQCFDNIKTSMILNQTSENLRNRFICTFTPLSTIL